MIKDEWTQLEQAASNGDCWLYAPHASQKLDREQILKLVALARSEAILRKIMGYIREVPNEIGTAADTAPIYAKSTWLMANEALAQSAKLRGE